MVVRDGLFVCFDVSIRKNNLVVHPRKLFCSCILCQSWPFGIVVKKFLGFLWRVVLVFENRVDRGEHSGERTNIILELLKQVLS